MAAQQSTDAPWHAAFPNPTATPGAVSRSEVLGWLSRSDGPLDYVLVDVRRVDHEVRLDGSTGLP